MYNNYPQLEALNKLTDTYVGLWVTGWFWPYFVMGNAGDWEKLGITMNGAKPMCTTRN